MGFKSWLSAGLGLALGVQQAAAVIHPASFHPNPKMHAARERELLKRFKEENTLKEYNFSVPIDHFHNDSRYEPHSDGFFDLRYWVDDRFYKPGGPVIVVNSGELTSEFRHPYVTTGIGKILSEAYSGLTVLLEHRYYGTSYPVPNLETENMRFLSTEQALADAAYFARNIKYPGYEDHALTSDDTPYIMYGGSYAGAYVALARKIYPDVFWGAISGSGVPQVYLEFWEYMDAARYFVDPECVEITGKLIEITDSILLGDDEDLHDTLKDFWSLRDLDDVDFANSIHQGLLGLQSTHWDPDIDSVQIEAPNTHIYCAAVTDTKARWPSTFTIQEDVEKIIKAAGYGDEVETLTPQFLNFVGNSRSYVLKQLSGDCGDSALLGTSCLFRKGAINNTAIPQDMLRAWTWQTCTQWGYYVTGSGTPDDQYALISRLVDFEYASLLCDDGFGIPPEPDMETINQYGGLNFSHHRLAFVDGSHDPWRAAGVHRLGVNEDRKSTTSEPFILVDGGVHHWDEFGPKVNATGSWLPPKAVTDVQDEEVRFVGVWLNEWLEEKGAGRQHGHHDASTDQDWNEL